MGRLSTLAWILCCTILLVQHIKPPSAYAAPLPTTTTTTTTPPPLPTNSHERLIVPPTDFEAKHIYSVYDFADLLTGGELGMPPTPDVDIVREDIIKQAREYAIKHQLKSGSVLMIIVCRSSTKDCDSLVHTDTTTHTSLAKKKIRFRGIDHDVELGIFRRQKALQVATLSVQQNEDGTYEIHFIGGQRDRRADDILVSMDTKAEGKTDKAKATYSHYRIKRHGDDIHLNVTLGTDVFTNTVDADMMFMLLQPVYFTPAEIKNILNDTKADGKTDNSERRNDAKATNSRHRIKRHDDYKTLNRDVMFVFLCQPVYFTGEELDMLNDARADGKTDNHQSSGPTTIPKRSDDAKATNHHHRIKRQHDVLHSEDLNLDEIDKDGMIFFILQPVYFKPEELVDILKGNG